MAYNRNGNKKTQSLTAVFPFFIMLCLFLGSFLLVFQLFAPDIYAEPRVPFIAPLRGEFIVKFRQPYWDEEKEVERRHTGIDIAGSNGDHVRASGSGIVSYTGFSPIGGRTLVIKHNEKIRTTYLNLSAIFVSVGTNVKQGDIIAAIGAEDDPSSVYPHLHFGIIYNGKYLDPEDVLNIDYSSISRFISLKYLESDFMLKK
jgi:murein DD-endopeptidase MepM/ murein hydrolase activator NlpD